MALLISFIIYTCGIVLVGLFASRFRKKSHDDFFLANRELGSWSSAISASASSESGWVMLGLVGAAFTGGISSIWLIPGCAAGYLFNWYVLADRLRKASAETESQTLPEFLAARFDSRSVPPMARARCRPGDSTRTMATLAKTTRNETPQTPVRSASWMS